MLKWFAVLAALSLGAAIVFALRGPRDSGLPRAAYSAASRSAVAASMCSWREPKSDMAAFFPGATGYHADTVVLSRHKVAIEKRLGGAYHMDSTALYVYRIEQGGAVVGTVAVRRVAGPHGAIEVVAALDPNRRIAGVRIQRMREPEPAAKAISNPQWLGGFRGMSADSFDSPASHPLPPDASEAAEAVRTAVRSLLVEMDEGETASWAGRSHSS